MTNQEKRIKLALLLGWRENVPPEAAGWWTHDANKDHRVGPPDPFTDANDERAVFRFMCGKIFSVRRLFFIELNRIVQERLDVPIRDAWPEAMMFIKDGDIAHAALKVIKQ